MKRVLILVSSRPHDRDSLSWNGLKDWLNTLLGGAAHVDIAAFSRLVYVVGKKTAIYDPEQGFDLADFDLVIFRTVGREIEQQELGISATHYLKLKQVSFIDNYLDVVGRGKLASSFPRVAEGLPVPQTIYANKQLLRAAVEREALFTYPFILKADRGKKGRDNFLITSDEVFTEVLNNAQAPMVAQEFIPNDGDYRVLVTGSRVGMVMLRKGSGDTHLNNTSQGGRAILIDQSSLPKEIIRDSLRAAELDKLQVAGVDVMIDKRDGRYYFLEVNRSPQVYTGAFTDAKMQAYAAMIKEYLR